MVHLTKTPLALIRRAVVYENTKKLPLSKIVEEQQPDIAFTGVFYNSKWKPVCPVKADGEVLYADTQYNYWALAWDEGSDAAPELILPGGASMKKNYAANCVLVTGGQPHKTLYYNADVGGVRGRVATGLTAAGEWLVCASADGSSGAMTPEVLGAFMADQGCTFAMMLDGGRKVNYYNRAEDVLVEGKDPSQNLILLWLDQGEETAMGDIKTYSVKTDGAKKLSANFRVREFACNDGSDTVLISDKLVELLQATRDHFGKAVAITSGYRTAGYNAKVGGASKSQHVRGTAADIILSGDVDPLEVAQFAEFLMPDHGGIGVYQTFTHIDVRAARSRWDSRSGTETAVAGFPGYAEATEADLAVAWVQARGIMMGDASGALMLDQPVTRRQFAVMLYRFAQGG